MQRIPAHVTLRSLRVARGLTGPALADRLRERGVTVDEDHIYSVELGHKNPGLALRTAWAEELGVSPRDIRTGGELRELIADADAGEHAA
jgi:transcriptional regulator with XRE-family HTH domain